MEESDGAWQQRYKCEQILEVGCPRCGALPHKWCNRDGEQAQWRAGGSQGRDAAEPPGTHVDPSGPR